MKRTYLTIVILGLLTLPLMGDSMTPVSVQGTADFQQSGDNWTITTGTTRTVIDWSAFNVATGAEVHFEQPGTTSVVLNRVVGSDISTINGLLSSNGAVYLFNNNGVVIGPSGTIKVASFIASTLNVSNDEFLAGGQLNLVGDSQASIVNYGKIEAIGGNIYMIATKIVNQGTITASSGSVNLAAGNDVLLTQDGDLYIRPSSLSVGGTGIDNSGLIDATVARLQADGNMYALAINNSGVIRATGAQTIEGHVLLCGDGGSVVNRGSLIASTVQADGSAVGGKVEVFGTNVTLADGSLIDASGDGVGGFVETSGDVVTVLGGSIKLGSGGEWLLDPVDVTVDSVLANTIVGVLDAGATYTLSAVNIYVNSAIVATTATSASALVLNATSAIAINADINVGVGTLAIIAQAGATQASGTTLTAGKLMVKGKGTFTLYETTNDFDVIAVAVTGTGSVVGIQDVDDVEIGAVGSVRGAAVTNGEMHIFTPNGYITCNGLFDAGASVLKAYHALGNVAIAETSNLSGVYQLQISNNSTVTVAEVEAFLGLESGSLSAIDPNTTTGSAVLLEYGALAGDSLAFNWDFLSREAYVGDSSANDYAFTMIDAGAGTAPAGYPEVLVDVVNGRARGSAVQTSGKYSWETKWGAEGVELDHTNPYLIGFGVMNVSNTSFESALYLNDVVMVGTELDMTYSWIYDHVEDFPHIKNATLTASTANNIMTETLNDVSTYFDATANGMFYTEGTSSTDPRYFYQSVGSIYQIPR